MFFILVIRKAEHNYMRRPWGGSAHLGGNSVQVTSSLAGQDSATVGVLLNKLQLLQSLQGLPGNGPGALGTMVGTGTGVLALSINSGESSDTDRRPHVDVSSNAGSSDEEPVLVEGGQLLGTTVLHKVNPLGDRHLTGLFQESSKSNNKLVLVNILY